ncbi:MAG: beta-N-acetylhexosaminidase [Proteobacteria bacterium]|nr:beta-N-acetylhexosaminidase [Pseudomonadota bacterium]MCP4915985.1 beta-N-acetylhexosaminidase [Pseudomonadota bacterium]
MSVPVEARGETTSLHERKIRAGQRLLIGIPGPSVDDATRALIRELRPAGFILFSRNVEEPGQVLELNRELASLVPDTHPAILSVDQEGGRVQRVKDGATRFPPLRWLGNCEDLDLTRRYAEALADEVSAMGFNLNWAPVADVDSNPANPIIGDRSFHRSAEACAAHVAAYVEATQARGVLACAKHFPGHGDTATDSHLTLPIVEKDPPDLEHCEVLPFVAAVRAQVATMMTAHVLYPGLDEHVPATMSPAILDGILRKRLGYDGLVVSDDLEMKAVRGRYELLDQLTRACQATVDLFLVCSDQKLQVETFEALVRLQEEDPGQQKLAEDAMARLLATRRRFFLDATPAPELSVLDSSAHRELIDLVRERGQA